MPFGRIIHIEGWRVYGCGVSYGNIDVFISLNVKLLKTSTFGMENRIRETVRPNTQGCVLEAQRHEGSGASVRLKVAEWRRLGRSSLKAEDKDAGEALT